MLDDQLPTYTSEEQRDLERRVSVIYADFVDAGQVDENDEELVLNREAHVRYLHGGLGQLPSGFIALDASRTWLVYWVLHSLALLQAPLPDAPSRADIVAFLAACQHPEGGFGGGPYQLAHLAPTYAAVAALVTLGGDDALRVVDRLRLQAFLLRMCVPPERGGGMTMHEGGEVDVRGCYCALAVCHMLRLDKAVVVQACDLVGYISRCQSHEGGVGGEPFNEGHGGYAFCGLAAAALAGVAREALDLRLMLRWAAERQGAMEGGFMGRTNKLVDGCYSFWLGGVFPILAGLLQEEREQEGQGQEQGSAPHHREQQQRPAAAAGSGLRPRGTHGLGALQQKGSTVANRAEASAMPDVANRLADMLLSGGTDWVASLDTAPPLEVAQRQLVRLQAELDAAVEASLAAEDALKVAVEGDAPGSRVEELKQEAVELVERSAEAQCNLEQGRSHVEFTTTSATVLLAAEGGEGGRAAGAAAGVTEGATAGGGSGSSRQPQLYNAQALQLWLLKCCQGAHGGMKDKPGKAPDFYHTCYCLSGLASAQQHSGRVLGPESNRLATADPLCNVVADKLAAAVAHFSSGIGSCSLF